MFLFLNFFLSFFPLSEIWKLASMVSPNVPYGRYLQFWATLLPFLVAKFTQTAVKLKKKKKKKNHKFYLLWLSSLNTIGTDVALIENNAKVGSQIAKELAEIRKTKGQSSNSTTHQVRAQNAQGKSHEVEGYDPAINYADVPQGRPVVIGGSIVDLLATVNDTEIKVSFGRKK